LFTRRVSEQKTNKNWNQICNELFNETNIVKKEKDEMLIELENLKNKLGRTPLTDELTKNGLQSFNAYRKKFKVTFNELVSSLGWETNVACTPAGSSMFDKRSCREKTGCTRECLPRTLKCEWCESMNSNLNVLEEVETGKHVSICRKCMESIREDIIR
jgi:hypothetical protein